MAAISFDDTGSAYEGDELEVATWIVDPDGRVRLARQFQIRRLESGRTLARGYFKFVCTNLDTGRPYACRKSSRDLCDGQRAGGFGVDKLCCFSGVEALGIPFKSRIIKVRRIAEEFVTGATSDAPSFFTKGEIHASY